MNVITELSDTGAQSHTAPFFLWGKVAEDNAVTHRSRDLGVSFTTPELDLDALVLPRTRQGPLFDVPLKDIIDFLVQAGERIADRSNPHIAECVERMCLTNVLPRRVIENQFVLAGHMLGRNMLTDIVEQNFRDPAVLDGWAYREDRDGRKGYVRACPPRLIHVLPGNSAVAAVQSIGWASLTKAVNLFKMGSSDPFTAVAVLRTMADIDPDHPVVRSSCAVYWRGGDEVVERALYRPQYFDKIVAWGGGDAINNVVKYLGPGFQLISFDPKTSISMIGREAFTSYASIEEVAERAARDVSILNQEACVASRLIYVEGDGEEVDRFCAKLLERIGVDRPDASAEAPPLERALVEEIEALELMDDDFRVWGLGAGKGLVIRSDQPVDFHPVCKTANVVRVRRLEDALPYVNVATQTVGVYPFSRAFELRDGLASGGAQRVTRLGDCGGSCAGAPHDATYPLHRFVHWVAHEDGAVGDPQ